MFQAINALFSLQIFPISSLKELVPSTAEVPSLKWPCFKLKTCVLDLKLTYLLLGIVKLNNLIPR